jgi:hypothetical protein
VENTNIPASGYKRQHYVPRFYLKFFSTDGDKLINIGLIKQRKIVSSVEYSSQCYEEYFYGKDLKLEKNVFSPVDAEGSRVLTKIMKEQAPPKEGSAEWQHLYLYVHLQIIRTKASYDEAAARTLELETLLFKEYLKSKGHPDADPKLEIRNHPSEGMKMILSACADGVKNILDLKCKLLVNDTANELVTSDNPVALINPLFQDRYEGSSTGLAQRGIQIIFPISPKHALIFYDNSVYQMGEKKRQTLYVRSTRDINWLNQLQHLNASECIYFKSISSSSIVSRDFRDASLDRDISTQLYPAQNGDVLIRLSRDDIKVKGLLNFCEYHVKPSTTKIKLGQVPYRNPEYIQMQKLFDYHVLNGKYKQTEWDKFLDDFELGVV